MFNRHIKFIIYFYFRVLLIKSSPITPVIKHEFGNANESVCKLAFLNVAPSAMSCTGEPIQWATVWETYIGEWSWTCRHHTPVSLCQLLCCCCLFACMYVCLLTTCLMPQRHSEYISETGPQGPVNMQPHWNIWPFSSMATVGSGKWVILEHSAAHGSNNHCAIGTVSDNAYSSKILCSHPLWGICLFV